MNSFSEAEIQVLIVLVELVQPKETPNNNFYHFYPQSVEEAAAYFRGYRVDWSEAYPTLIAKGLVRHNHGSYELTDSGLAAARPLRDERPPIFYWYKEYYTTTSNSPTYSRFCAELYGKYLCQTNFSDMEQIEKMLGVLSLKPGERVLDLGCGKGMIAEYISDVTGAHLTGIDYCPEAIDQALQRTAAKRDRLHFQVQNLDALDFPPLSFDAIVSIDTLYMPNNLDDTLQRMFSFLNPGGKLAVFYMNMCFDSSGDRSSLTPEGTPLGLALRSLGRPFKTWDFSEQTYRHMQRKHALGQALKADFQKEGNLSLYQYIINESESSTAAYDPASCYLSRYLYYLEK